MSVFALTMAFSDLKWIKSRYGERESDPFRAFMATATTTTKAVTAAITYILKAGWPVDVF